MPRKARIDAPGAFHHIIVRGIARKKIYDDDIDRDFFVDRMGIVLADTKTSCFAWALIPNHFHLLLKTGDTPIATVMKRLLTGYAMQYNRRHRRHGHLFQNRYKSILCQEDAYLLELVRYIHLKPHLPLFTDIGQTPGALDVKLELYADAQSIRRCFVCRFNYISVRHTVEGKKCYI